MNALWFLLMLFEMLLATKWAIAGDIARTILHCFSSYVCVQFLVRGKGGEW